MLVVLNNKCNFEKESFKKYIKELNKITTANEVVLCPRMLVLIVVVRILVKFQQNS